MSFSIHTFETHSIDENLSFSFHEVLAEGQELVFLSRFPDGTKSARSIAESLYGVLLNDFKNSRIKDSYDRLESALKHVNMEARKFNTHFSEPPRIIIAFFDFNNLYLSQSGESEAYLLREASISQISEAPEEGEDLFLNILNGQVSVEDTIIFTTRRILRSMTSNQLLDVFSRANFSEACGLLRTELTGNSKEDFLVTVIGIGKKEKSPSAGFLSRVLPSKTPPPVEAELIDPTAKEATEEIPDESPQPPEPMEEEPPTEPTDESPKGETLPETMTIEEALSGAQKDEKKDSENSEMSTDLPPETDIPSPQEPLSTDSNPLPSPPPSYTPPVRSSNSIEEIFSRVKISSNWKNSKSLMKVAGVILGGLVIVVVYKSIANYESQETIALREKLSISREAFQQADALLLQGDRASAAEFLMKAKESAQEVMQSKSKNFRYDASTILSDIEAKQLQVENARKVTPNVLADLGIKNDGVDAVGIAELKGSLYAFDLKKVYKTIRNIVEKGLIISEKESLIAGSTREDQNTLLFITNTPRIVEYRDGVISPMSTADDTWKSGIDIQTYGRYAYVLDPVENQIWKYERRRDKYSGAIPYNKEADLSRATSFSIDGSIFIVSDDGTIQRLFRGEKVKYGFRDLPSVPFSGKNIKVFTRPDLDFLYVLDPENTRVLVFVKGDRFATYKKQVIYDIPNARDFSVDELGQKVNLLTNNKIYEFSL